VRQFFLCCTSFLLTVSGLFAQGIQNEDYIIGAEDVLSISVWREPDLSVRELVVRPDGKISLPLVNDIQASGTTPKQLQEQIAAKLKEFIESPNVNVVVIKVFSHSVTVVGQVSKPGQYPLGSPTTVLNMLARAGGLTEFAKAKDIKIQRMENGKARLFLFNYKNVINGKDLQQNILLKRGDTVMVP
jgi:polysaccharide biosynthesis/export protein